jgi:hypothetical protein
MVLGICLLGWGGGGELSPAILVASTVHHTPTLMLCNDTSWDVHGKPVQSQTQISTQLKPGSTTRERQCGF